MKRFNIYLGVLFSLIISVIIVGCVKNDNAPLDQEGLHEVVFHAGWAPETKTVLQEDGSVWWSPGDEISLFVGNGDNGGYKLTSTNTAPASKVDFVGKIGDNPNNATYTAIYPYNESNRIVGNTVFVTIPVEQVAQEGTFADGALVSVAVSSDENLFFKNVCSGIKFSVAKENINKIVIKSGDDAPSIGGKMEINLSDPSNPVSGNGTSSSVTITAPDGGCFKEGSYYYASLMPGTKSGGVEIEYYTSDNKVGYFISNNSTTFNRATVKRFYEKDKDLKFYPYYENTTNLYSYALLPDGVDKTTITNVSFIVNSDKTTDTIIYTDSAIPIYFEMNGTTANFYTNAEIYDLKEAKELFFGWTALKELDLSNIETSSVTDMSNMFAQCQSLKSITFGEFCTKNVKSMYGMFSDCWSLESLDLSVFQTGKVTNMRTMFAGCSSMKTLNLSSFNTSNVEDMSRMFGTGDTKAPNMIQCQIGTMSCSSLENLDLHTFNTSNVKNMYGLFLKCDNLKTVNLSGWNTSKVEDMNAMFGHCVSLKSIDLSSFDTRNVSDMSWMFIGCSNLVSLDLSNFHTPKVVYMNNMFCECENLQSLDISGFESTSLTNAWQFLFGAHNLKQLDLGNFDLSKIEILTYAFSNVAIRSKSVAIKCLESSKHTIENLVDNYFNIDYVTWVGPNEAFPDLPPDVIDPNMYYSNDYSMDKKVKLLQTATVGKGVDIVIMGDAYSDRLITDGTYERDMRDAIDAIFGVEPMKSYKELFNVYMIYAVSQNEDYRGSTVFSIRPVGNDFASGNLGICKKYTKIALPNKPLSDVAVIVIGHDTEAYVSVAPGVAVIEYDFDYDEYVDYSPATQSVAFVGRHSDANEFIGTVVHEFGHLFAKLADEYVEMEAYDEYDIQSFENLCQHLGIYKNIDFTSDPETIKWSKFLKDSRYSNEGLGVYEGALLSSKGVWRPTESSIMSSVLYKRGFNAPSREAIYYRIHKLAYSDSWQYDYETFVQQDLKNIQQSAPSQVKNVPYPARVNRKPVMKIEKSISANGKKKITLIMN